MSKLTKEEYEMVSQAIDEELERMENDGDTSYKPLIKLLYSAYGKIRDNFREET